MELTMDQPIASMPGLVARHARSHGNQTILRTKNRGIWKTVTWAGLSERVTEIGAAMLEAGLGHGDVVAILAETRPEAVYADLAIQGCGAASVAIDPDDDADRVCHALSSSGSRMAFVENEEQLDKVLAIRDRCPALSRIVVFDMKGLRDFADAGCTGLSSFIASGDKAAWIASANALSADRPAVIQFPRGQEYGLARILTHGDIVHMVGVARARLPLHDHDDRLVVLRLSDITERVWGLYLALETRCISNYPEGPDTVLENLRELQPTVLGADAATWTHLQTLSATRAQAATAAQRRAYTWAMAAAHRGGTGARLANLLVLPAVRREFGLNRLRTAYVGGASLDAQALGWSQSLGIAVQRVDEVADGAEYADERYRTLIQDAYA